MMMGGFGMGLGMLLVIGLPILLLVGGAAVLVGVLGQKPAVHQNPRQILDSRLARGEISVEEHDVLRQRLETARTAE